MCVRATISREARLAWKSTMESANPDVRFDSEIAKAKVASLADSDAQHLCYALTTHVPSNCRVVHSIDDRAFCVAVSNRDTVLCGPIRR